MAAKIKETDAAKRLRGLAEKHDLYETIGIKPGEPNYVILPAPWDFAPAESVVGIYQLVAVKRVKTRHSFVDATE